MGVPAVAEEWNLAAITDSLHDPALSYEQFTDICARLGGMYATIKKAEGYVKFAIGDAILAGEMLFGHRSYQAYEEFGLSEEVLRECARVSQRVPRSLRRMEELSWSHHRAVAPLEIPEQKAWLERAVRENLGNQPFRDALRNPSRNGSEPTYCGECGRPL